MIRLACSTLLLGFLAACAPTETGNPDAAITLVGEASDTNFALEAAPVEGSLTIAEAWFVFSEVSYVPESCDVADGTALSGPLTVDLANESRVFANTLDEVSYCEFRVGRSVAAVDAQPAQLAGAHLLVRGWRHDGVPLTVRSTATPELVARGFMGAAFDVAADRSYLMVLNLSSLFDEVDPFDSVLSSDGSITISSDSNADQLAALEASVDPALSLVEDKNGNRLRDSDETQTLAKNGF